MFTFKDIQNLANDTSFQRGKSYLDNGYVKNLKFKDNVFTAKVHGSERYDVSITLDKTGDIGSTYCDCPYDYDGDCKHIVAVGLAALEYIKTQSIEDIAYTPFEDLHKSSPLDFEKSYAKADDTTKILFLNQLLTKNIDLQQAFTQFVNTKNQSSKPEIKLNVIDEISNDIYEALSDLEFSEDTFTDYAQGNDYDYYDESFGESETEEMVTEVLEPYQKRIDIYMSEGRIIDAMTTWLGVYEGILAATEPQQDDYDMVGDYVDYNKNLWTNLTQNAIETAQKRPFAQPAIKQVLDLLIERYSLFEKDEKSELFYDLKDFEKLLIAIVNDVESAAYLKEIFEKKDLIDTPTIYVMLHVAELLNDHNYWLELSKDYAKFDAKIAQNLLDWLKDNDQINEFITQAKLLFSIHKNDIDKLIFNTLQHEQEPTLYVNALKNYCLRRKEIQHYNRLRPYLTTSEKDDIINSQKSYSLNIFYAELLETEERFNEILIYIRQDSLWLDSRMPQLVEIATKYFPTETLDLVKKYARASLASGQRGRTIYAPIAAWLAAVKKNPETEKQVVLFTTALVSEYNRMPALKDELRAKGLKF